MTDNIIKHVYTLTDDMNDLVLMGLARDSAYAEVKQLQERVAELENALNEITEFFRGDPASDDYEVHNVIDRARAALKGKDDG